MANPELAADVPVRAQALNYRLPYIPTYKPRLLSNVNKNITTYTGKPGISKCECLFLYVYLYLSIEIQMSAKN